TTFLPTFPRIGRPIPIPFFPRGPGSWRDSSVSPSHIIPQDAPKVSEGGEQGWPFQAEGRHTFRAPAVCRTLDIPSTPLPCHDGILGKFWESRGAERNAR